MPIADHLELLGARLLVRPLPELELSAGGIVMPEQSRHQQNRAIVERVGPGERLENQTIRPLALERGDLVFYQKYAGVWVTLDQDERLMLLEDEIQARVPAVHVALVTHPDAEHLEGEPCAICTAPARAASKAWMLEERQRLLADRQGENGPRGS